MGSFLTPGFFGGAMLKTGGRQFEARLEIDGIWKHLDLILCGQ